MQEYVGPRPGPGTRRWLGRALVGLACVALPLLMAGCNGEGDINRLAAEARAACTPVAFNGQAETGDLSGWTLTTNGGDGWAVCAAGQFCTSWSWDRKQQTIDLAAAGVPLSVLDAGADIQVSENFAIIYPQTLTYNLTVTLLDSAMTTIAGWSTGDTATSTSAGVAHQFSGYSIPGNPVRYLLWEDGGVDGLGWAGWYGPRLYGATLRVGNRCL